MELGGHPKIKEDDLESFLAALRVKGRAASTLAPASRAVLKAIDLHFHDLRHEGASGLLEAGGPDYTRLPADTRP